MLEESERTFMLKGYFLFKSKPYLLSFTFDISIILKSFRMSSIGEKFVFRSKIKLKDKETKSTHSKEAKSKQ